MFNLNYTRYEKDGNRMKRTKIIRLFGSIFPVVLLTGIIVIDAIVENTTRDKIYNTIEQIPHNRVGLLLGTSRFLSNGRLNLYYKYRINAAYNLYKAEKIDFILVSGDNSSKSYDEPTSMKNDLMAKGIPAKRIYLDYAGLRTLDSIVRSKKIFNLDSVTVISQQFHNERAIFIAEMKGVEAIGFNARSVNARYGFKTRVREKLARVKMVLDLILGTSPRFLGEAIEIK